METNTMNHPSFRSEHHAPPVTELRRLAEQFGVDVTITGGPQDEFLLTFGGGYTTRCITFEDACEELRSWNV